MSDSTNKRQARTNEALAAATSSLRKATCLSTDWPNGLAKVNIPGAEVDLPMIGVPPIINDWCQVANLGGVLVVLGPVPRPPYATVKTAPAAGLVTVLCDDNVERTVTYDGGTLDVGTRVRVDWDGGGEIIGTPQADPYTGQLLVKPTAPNVPPPGSGLQSRTFFPSSSGTWADGTYTSGWKLGDLRDSDHNRGAYFYQGIADTIPDGAQLVEFKLQMPAGSGYGGAPSIGAHSLSGPAGNLSITGRKAISPGGGSIDISEFFDGFKTGALRGIGTGGGGDWRFPGAGQGNSGAISASWRN